MEWFYNLLHSLIDSYVDESGRDDVKSYVDTILNGCLEVCAKNLLIDASAVYRLFGLDLRIQRFKSNNIQLYNMKLTLGELAYEYFLAQMNREDKRKWAGIILEAENIINGTMRQLQWSFTCSGSAEQKKRTSEASSSEESPDEKAVHDDWNPRPMHPDRKELQETIAVMFTNHCKLLSDHKNLLSLETRFGVLSKLLDILQGLHTLPGGSDAYVLQTILQISELPDSEATDFFKKIGYINSFFTTDVYRKFVVHLQKELYLLETDSKNKNHKILMGAAAYRLYSLLWESLNPGLTPEIMANLIKITLENLKKCLASDIPFLLEAVDLIKLPPRFFSTQAGVEFYVNLQKELFDLLLNQPLDDNVIDAAGRLYVSLWEINMDITPDDVTAIVRSALHKLIDGKLPSPFAAINPLPWPDNYFRTVQGTGFLERLQNEVIPLLLTPCHDKAIVVAGHTLYAFLPELLMGVTQAKVGDLLKSKWNKLKYKLHGSSGSSLFTFDLLKYAVYADRVLGGTAHDPVVNHQFNAHFPSNTKYHKQAWKTGIFSQLVLGLLILYIKQDESFIVPNASDFWLDNLLFLENPSNKKEILSLEREVFALTGHNVGITHDRLQRFVSEQPETIRQDILSECALYGDAFYNEIAACYKKSGLKPHRVSYSSCFFPSAMPQDTDEWREMMLEAREESAQEDSGETISDNLLSCQQQ